jgi:tetratricopeptide (TPR) repeat protein
MKTIGLIVLILVISCSDNNGNDNEKIYEKEIESAWSAFNSGDYDEAINFFNKAKANNPNRYEAFLGLSWSILLNNSTQSYNEVKTNAEQVLTLKAGQKDAIAALGLVENLLKNYTESNTQISSLAALDNNWFFSQKQSITILKLYMVEAQNHFQLGNYASSLTSIKKVNPSFIANTTVYLGIIALQNEIERLNNDL